MKFVKEKIDKFIKISVVTISYNQGAFLENAIRSILMQNYPNIEYIIIDGGSTDDSVKIIKKYESFLKYWISEEDLGPANALNKGLRFCEGEYFYYLNSDDILEPDIFNFINNYIQLYTGYDVYYGHGYMTYKSPSNKFPIYSSKWNLEQYIHSLCSIFQQSTFINLKKIKEIGGFNENNRTHWDGELLVTLDLNNATFKRYNKHVAIFRMYAESLSGNSNKEKYLADFRLVKVKVKQLKKFKNRKVLALRLIQYLNDPIITLKRLIIRIKYIK